MQFGPEISLGTAEANPARLSCVLLLMADCLRSGRRTKRSADESKQRSGASLIRQNGALAAAQRVFGCIGRRRPNLVAAKRVNSVKEAIQGEENGPKVAFGADNRAYVVWSIPGEKGDKTRANIRFADG